MPYISRELKQSVKVSLKMFHHFKREIYFKRVKHNPSQNPIWPPKYSSKNLRPKFFYELQNMTILKNISLITSPRSSKNEGEKCPWATDYCILKTALSISYFSHGCTGESKHDWGRALLAYESIGQSNIPYIVLWLLPRFFLFNRKFWIA